MFNLSFVETGYLELLTLSYYVTNINNITIFLKESIVISNIVDKVKMSEIF